jgi:hypothetical protein
MSIQLRFSRRWRRLVMVGVTALFAIATPLTAWAALSASVANGSFPAVTYSHANQTASTSITLTATDTGQCILTVCTNQGWNVTLVASSFAYSGPNSGTAIPAANLAITNAHAPIRVSGQAIDATHGPRTTNVTGALNVARKTLQADGPTGTIILTYYGIGTYQQAIDVNLVVPGLSRAGTYTTTLTVTISAGP